MIPTRGIMLTGKLRYEYDPTREAWNRYVLQQQWFDLEDPTKTWWEDVPTVDKKTDAEQKVLDLRNVGRMEAIASQIVEGIFKDMSDRNGVGDELQNIDEETTTEIKGTWQKMIMGILSSE